MDEKQQYKPKDNFNIFVHTNTGINSFYAMTDYDLLDQYKTALIQGKGVLIWENGVIDCSKIVGITKN